MAQHPNYATVQVTISAREDIRTFTWHANGSDGQRANMSEALQAAIRVATEEPDAFRRHLDQILANRVDGRLKSSRAA